MAKKNSLMDQIQQRTRKNIVKARSGSGKTTYLDRFVDVLTDDDGNPTEPMERTEIIGAISCQIVEEKIAAQIAKGDRKEDQPFELTETMDSPDDLLLAEVNRKVRGQVANAVASNNNSTSLSYNDKYKDKYKVVKHDGNKISLALKSAE